MNDSSTEQAINRVLEAEREARQHVVQCREEAERQVEEARLKARRIIDRTDSRIRRVHELVDRSLSAEKSVFEDLAGTLAPEHRFSDDERKRLNQAVEQLLTTWMDGSES